MIFLYEYEHDGCKFSLEIEADNWIDANNKAQSIKDTIMLSGKLEEVVPIWDSVELNLN